MDNVNRAAVELVDEAIDFADELNLEVRHLDNEAVVLDFGIEADGGIEAGLLLAEIQTGGLATVQTRVDDLGSVTLPFVELSTDHPALSLLGCQQSAWIVRTEGFSGYGAGPARVQADNAGAGQYAQATDFDLTVLALEADTLPDADVVETVAEATGVGTAGVFLPTAPTASIVGSVTMAARAAEVALERFQSLGGDPTAVVSATGSAPVAPVADGYRAAMARTNDAIAYGGRAHLVVESAPSAVDELAFESSAAYGESFETVLGAADWDLLNVDQSVFAPAQVTVDVRGGPTHAVGSVEPDRLASLLDCHP
ncbi:MAG: methenyltetrahydromethanopterin cyclohydrolase [Halobacteriales archaeon]